MKKLSMTAVMIAAFMFAAAPAVWAEDEEGDTDAAATTEETTTAESADTDETKTAEPAKTEAKNDTATTTTAAAPAETPVNKELQREIREGSVPRSHVVLGNILFYIPNRIMDIFDIFTLDITAGPQIGFDFNLTQAFGFGAGVGCSVGAYKEVNRQYGFAQQEGWYAQFLFLQAEDQQRTEACGTLQNYVRFGDNFPLCTDKMYNFWSGSRDYWSIEASAACLVGVKTSVEPTEIVDFLCGLILFDGKKFVAGPWTKDDGFFSRIGQSFGRENDWYYKPFIY